MASQISQKRTIDMGHLKDGSGSITVDKVDTIYYQDQREQIKTTWEIFKNSLAAGAGWAIGASAVGWVSYKVFAATKAGTSAATMAAPGGVVCAAAAGTAAAVGTFFTV